MAAAFRSASSTTYTSRTNTTITAPAGIQDGDVLAIVFLSGGSPPPTPTAPSGFTVATGYPASINSGGFSVTTYLWTKTASAEAGNYTVTHATASSQGYMCAASAALLPLSPNPTTNTGTASGSAATTSATGLTTPSDGSLVIFLSVDFGDATATLTVPSGTTPSFNPRLNPGTTSGLMFIADGVLAVAGATGTKTATNNSVLSGNPWLGSLISIPSGAPPAFPGGGGGGYDDRVRVERSTLQGNGTGASWTMFMSRWPESTRDQGYSDQRADNRSRLN